MSAPNKLLAKRLRMWEAGRKLVVINNHVYWATLIDTEDAMTEASVLMLEAADVLSLRAPERTEEE